VFNACVSGFIDNILAVITIANWWLS